MEEFNEKDHWERIYKTKGHNEVSWFQNSPKDSLDALDKLGIGIEDEIIDIGAGDSFFIEHLLDRGYKKLSVLDISQAAITRAQDRIGERSNKVNWIVSNAAKFIPTKQYDFWHDRATFHFLTSQKDIGGYINALKVGLSRRGKVFIGTFSESGPTKCSGIPIQQYSENKLEETFAEELTKIECHNSDHRTPFDTVQNFTFCSFRRK